MQCVAEFKLKMGFRLCADFCDFQHSKQVEISRCQHICMEV